MVAPTQSIMEPEPTIRISNNDFVEHKASPQSPSNNNNKNKKQRSVRFAGSIDVHVIENRYQFTQEEIQNAFLSKRELEDIRWNIRACLQKMLLTADVEDGGDEELRGLESYAPNQYLARIQRMRLAARTLIKQQEFGTLDDRWLLYKYSALTEVSVHTARVRGLKDQQPDPASPPFQQIMVR